MSGGPLVVVGDALLDRDLAGRSGRLSPDASVPVVERVVEQARPGGAGLAALLAARDGREVVLVTALGDDPAADSLRRLLGAELELAELPWSGPTAQKVRVRAGDTPLVRLDFGDEGGTVGGLSEPARKALAGAGAVLVADYGRGVAAQPELRAALSARVGAVPLVWDPHPRGARPVRGVTLATPNCAEAEHFSAGAFAINGRVPDDPPEVAAARRCVGHLRHDWAAAAVAVTVGRHGALLDAADGVHLVPAPVIPAGDPCGAGDRFSAAVTGQLLDGMPLVGAVRVAVETAAR